MPAFLFTDVEGSTRLWEEQPAAMAPSLERHYSLLTDAVISASGRVLKTTGDGMVAVFPSADGAVSAALEAQRSLSSDDTRMMLPLRVRMGIHAGDAEETDEDFFGPVLNRAARIMAAAHGGQVLVSSKIAELAREVLPAGADLRDLGTHRLRDLTLPEHLYQLVHGDITNEFPPPLTLETSPNNLPLQTTEFLGRSDEMHLLRSMLMAPATRLLTMFGPGGSGKTRLGLQLVAETMDEFKDGALFVDLSNELDPESAFEAVVRTLDIPASGSGSPLEVLKTRLRDREMILMLDNFEQVTSAGTGVVELIQHCPDLKVVVTSRETLRVRAEHVFPVPPMSMADPSAPVGEIASAEAVQLFAVRARAVRPDFTLDSTNAGTVARICLRLDGIPLAIELAAARMKLFSPSDLLQRLQGRLDVLGSGGRDLPDRQRTLWSAIAWSYELLDETESRVFEMMSVFSLTRIEAIEAVADEVSDAVDLYETLASLVDKSLVKSEDSEGSRRFSMLQMIRDYAADRLAQDPEYEETVRRAHAEYFRDYALALGEQLTGQEREEVLSELSFDIGNLRLAWRYWVVRGDLEELFALLEGLWALHDAKGWYHAAIELAHDTLGVLATSEPSPERTAEELALRTSLARALFAVKGYDVEVENAFRQILEMSRDAGSAAQQFPVMRALATFYISIADWEAAKLIGGQIMELGETSSDETIIIDGHYVHGISTVFMGDLATGMPHVDEAIRRYDPAIHGGKRFQMGPVTGVTARVGSGFVLWQAGFPEQAVSRITDALSMAVTLGHPYSLAYATYHSGFLAILRGRFEECQALSAELGLVAAENDYAVWGTLSQVLEGVSLTFMGEIEKGLALTEAGIDLYQGLTTPPVFLPLILLLRGLVNGFAGNPERGLELIDEAIALGGANELATADFHIVRGDVLMLVPQPDVAAVQSAYESAISGARVAGLRMIELQARTRLVAMRNGAGITPDGSDDLRTLYDWFTEGFEERDLQMARGLLDLTVTSPEGP